MSGRVVQFRTITVADNIIATGNENFTIQQERRYWLRPTCS